MNPTGHFDTCTHNCNQGRNCHCPKGNDMGIFPPLLTGFIFGALAAILFTTLLLIQ